MTSPLMLRQKPELNTASVAAYPNVSAHAGADPVALLADKLASLSDDTFLAGLAELHLRSGKAYDVALIAAVAHRWGEGSLLTTRTQADRLRSLLAKIGFPALNAEPALTESLIALARSFPPHLKNAVAEVLTPAERRSLWQAVPTPEALDESVHRVTAVEGPACFIVARTTSILEEESGSLSDPTEANTAFTTVLLLSRPDYQEANKTLLRGEGFWPLVWDSIDRLRDDIVRHTDVCGFIVDQSILTNLDATSQRALFETLARYSTFAHIRVDERGLHLTPDEIRSILKQVRCMATSVPHEVLSVQQDGNLRSLEISEFRRASSLLSSHEDAQFVPSELSDDEGRLLVAAVRAHAQAVQFDGPVRVESIETRFLTGGFSGARIAVVRANHKGWPLVAKIAKKADVLDEMKRFRTFVQPVDDQLRPELHFHGNAALIFFALLPDPDDRCRPADVLEERLSELWNAQLFGNPNEAAVAWRRESLARALERVSSKLAELNAQAPHSTEFAAAGNPPVAHLEQLEASGFDWGLGAEAVEMRTRALSRFSLLADRAVVHGDIHLRNVLLRGESDAHLIDYAACGPGHPAIDLVRLELSLYLQSVRQLESEQNCMMFQRRFSLTDATNTELASEFPSFARCHVNAACLRGMIAARNHAIEVVRRYGGDRNDYIAAKYLLAWQNFGMPGRHTGLARATITALSQHLAAQPHR